MIGVSRTIGLFMILIVIGIFIGVDLTSRGVERLQGEPAGSLTMIQSSLASAPERETSFNEGSVVATNVQAQSELRDSAAQQEANRASSAVLSAQHTDIEHNVPLVDQAADKAGKFIQITFQHGIEWLVSFYDDLMN